jgi:hypothetical protein
MERSRRDKKNAGIGTIGIQKLMPQGNAPDEARSSAQPFDDPQMDFRDEVGTVIEPSQRFMPVAQISGRATGTALTRIFANRARA